MTALMRSRLFWRRSAAAAGTYASAALGFLGTVVALHIFSTEEFGRYALVLAATAFVQSLLDLTVEEALVKFGFRYTTREDWGRLRRLFESAVAFKLVGGVLGTGLLLALAPAADSLLHKQGLTTPLLIGAFLPLAQCTENVGGVPLILRGRYDIRVFFLFVSMALRLSAIAHRRAPRPDHHHRCDRGRSGRRDRGDQCCRLGRVSALPTGAVGSARRRPARHPLVRRAVHCRDGAVLSLTAPLSLLVLGRVASTREVAFFRAAAMSPQQAFAVVSAPARLILLTEQTRAWERGTRDAVFAGIRRYMLGVAAVAVVILSPLLVFTPELAKLLFSAKNAGAVDATRLVIVSGALHIVYGWTKGIPVSISRPSLRIWTHGLEMLVLVPLVGVLGSKWGATWCGGGGADLERRLLRCVDHPLLEDLAQSLRRHIPRSCR